MLWPNIGQSGRSGTPNIALAFNFKKKLNGGSPGLASIPHHYRTEQHHTSEQMTANESVIAQLAVLEKACAEMRKTLGLAELSVQKA